MDVTGVSSTNNATAASTGATTSTSSSPADQMANEQTFLQLLVAQIKNQDPLQPTDSMQFVTQLAQFSSLEQLIGIRQDLDGMATAPNSSSSNSSTNSSSTA